ncbi:MAG TPA: SRPBCC family protein [Hyphomonadaceae bacterium]
MHPHAQTIENLAAPERKAQVVARMTAVILAACALVPLNAAAAPPAAASLTRSIDVSASPDAVWSAIGPFCAIKEWHPAIATCSEVHAPTVRTLVTKDGKATFVEPETARNDARRQYTYTFASAPIPVSHYMATIGVTPKKAGGATITWHGTWTPEPGKEKVALDALTGIYESGLDALKARFAK